MIRLIPIHVDDNEWEFEDDLVNASIHDELDQAIDFWHSGKYGNAEFVLKKIIAKNPYHIDTYEARFSGFRPIWTHY